MVRSFREREERFASGGQTFQWHFERGLDCRSAIRPCGGERRHVLVIGSLRYASAHAPVPCVAHVVVEHRDHVNAVLFAEDAADLLTEPLRVRVKTRAELWRHVGVEIEIPVLVRLADQLEMRSGVDDSLDAVHPCRFHHVVVAAGAHIECQLTVFPQHRKIDDRVATFCCCNNTIEIVGTDLPEFPVKTITGRVNVGQDDFMAVLQCLDHPRAKHAASSENENFHRSSSFQSDADAKNPASLRPSPWCSVG